MNKHHSTRIPATLLVMSLFLSILASCGGFGIETSEETEPPETYENPYFEQYIIDDLFENHFKNENFAHLVRYEYKDEESAIPMYMGGYPYYGGFVMQASGATPSASFDVRSLNDKVLSFVLGSTQTNGYQDAGVAVVRVSLDGEAAFEKRIAVPDTPEWYTLDLSGKSELTFEVTAAEGGDNWIGIAEVTVWDKGEKVIPTAHVKQEGGVRAQLMKDIFPYLFQPAGNGDTMMYTQTTPPAFMSGFTIENCISDNPASVGGKTYMEAFGLREDMPMTGVSASSIYFNTEAQYAYLSFMVGGEDVENADVGTAWLTVYADGNMVHEEMVRSDALPRRYTVPIHNCKVLQFEVQYEDGGASRPVVFDAFVGKTEADVVGTVESAIPDLPDVCKLVSSIRPYAVSAAEENPVFDGSSAYHTFTMAGRKYNEGLIFYPTMGLLTGNHGSYACFNLDGQFQHLTFTVGLLDKSPQIADETLNIYLDGVLAQTIPLLAMDLPQKHTIALNHCRELKLELSGKSDSIRPAYGLSEMVVYKGDVIENDLFPPEGKDYPDSMPLIENIKPYMTYVAYADEGEFQTVFDGSTKKEYFEIGEETFYSGLILCTSVHLDLLGTGNDGTVFGNLIYNSMIGGFVSMMASGVVHENSFSAFDVSGEFSTVTFTVACKEPLSGNEEQTELIIGTDGNPAKTIYLTPDMQPTTYTVDITDAEQLLFFLKCGDSWSAYYAIYDITVTK